MGRRDSNPQHVACLAVTVSRRPVFARTKIERRTALPLSYAPTVAAEGVEPFPDPGMGRTFSPESAA